MEPSPPVSDPMVIVQTITAGFRPGGVASVTKKSRAAVVTARHATSMLLLATSRRCFCSPRCCICCRNATMLPFSTLLWQPVQRSCCCSCLSLRCSVQPPPPRLRTARQRRARAGRPRPCARTIMTCPCLLGEESGCAIRGNWETWEGDGRAAAPHGGRFARCHYRSLCRCSSLLSSLQGRRIPELPLHPPGVGVRSPRAAAAVTDLQGKGAEREGEGRGTWEGSWGGRKSREARGSEGLMEESRGRTGDSGKRMEKGSSGGREKSRENGEKIRMSMTSSLSGRNTNRW